MTVYLDLVVLYNIAINFIFLFLLEKLFRNKINYYRLILASVIGGLLVVGLILSNIVRIIMKIGGGALIIMIVARKRNKKRVIVEISSFYLLNFAFAGFLSSFGINRCLLLIVGIVVIIGFALIDQFRFIYATNKKTKYQVVIKLNNKRLMMEAFFDTGNFSTDDNFIPIIYLDNKYYMMQMEKVSDVLVDTIIGSKYIPCYKPEYFAIKINKQYVKKEVLIAFADIEEECLLNTFLLC